MRVTKPPGRVGGRIPRGIVVAWIWCGSVVSALTSPDAACFGARSFSDRFFPKMTMCGSLRKGVGSGDKASLSEANDYAAPLADDRNVSPDRRRACKASPAGGAARPFHVHACAYQNTGDIYGGLERIRCECHGDRATAAPGLLRATWSNVDLAPWDDARGVCDSGARRHRVCCHACTHAHAGSAWR